MQSCQRRQAQPGICRSVRVAPYGLSVLGRAFLVRQGDKLVGMVQRRL